MEENEQSRFPQLPAAFAPLQPERDRIEKILARLAEADDPTERADLGDELVRSMSRYEDTLDRSAWSVASHSMIDVGPLDQDRDALRESMTVIYEATKHVDARNVHAPDPEGFEAALDDVQVRIRSMLEKEDGILSALDASLTEQDRADVSAEVMRSFRNASEKPVPPKTILGRIVANAGVKLDHNFEDASTPQHPAAETVKEEE